MTAIFERSFPQTEIIHPQEDIPPSLVIKAKLLASYHDVPQEYIPDVARLVHKGVLGYQAQKEGWDNVGRHCIQGLHMGIVLCELMGIEDEQRIEVCRPIIRHDEDIKINKTGFGDSTKDASGNTRIDARIDYYLLHENSHEGVIRVTSMDWRDWQEWQLPEMVLRYVDSCLDDDRIVHWQERIEGLKKNKREADIAYGTAYYPDSTYVNSTGEVQPSAFTYLEGVVMPAIEEKLYQEIISAQPSLALTYREPTDVFTLISDQIHAAHIMREQTRYMQVFH